MVPMLPCADVDAIVTFWVALDLTQTYRPGAGPLFELFQAGLRTLYGKVPVSGFPRITDPASGRTTAACRASR